MLTKFSQKIGTLMNCNSKKKQTISRLNINKKMIVMTIRKMKKVVKNKHKRKQGWFTLNWI